MSAAPGLRPFPACCLAAAALLIGCSTLEAEAPEAMGAHASAVTVEQCEFFQVDGKVQICHRTSSAKNPYVIVRVSTQGCVDGHALHAGDYVAVNDPYCQSQGCFPVGAPLDAVAECCEGLVAKDGRCACPADTQCLTYAPNADGSCTATPRPAGTTCDDGLVTTIEDVCEAGTCAGHACQGAACVGTGLQAEAGAGQALYLEGASLTVPESLTLSLRSLVEAPPTVAANGGIIDARSPIYEFGPAGTAFAQPLTISFQVGADPDLVLFWSEDGTSWAELDVVIVGGTMTVTTDRFSRAVVAKNGCAQAAVDDVCGTAPEGACAAAPTCQSSGARLKCQAAFQPATTVCRAAASGCDVPEHCSGVSLDCPADALAAAGTLCRDATGSCDLAEVCDGLAPACPADAFVDAGTGCDDADPRTFDDACNGLGLCIGIAQPADECGRATPRTPVCDAEFAGASGTFTDARDGQSYGWVRIGRQIWMSENLNVGTQISTTQRQTDNCRIEKHCPANAAADCDLLGGMYEYDEMMQYVETAQTTGICPAGWYLPSTQDWQTLLTYVGGENNAAWLKTRATTRANALAMPAMLRNPLDASMYLDAVTGSHPFWSWPNTGARDRVGFGMMPANWTNATYNPSFPAVTVQNSANFWPSGSATLWQFISPLVTVGRYTNLAGQRAFGASVRCVSACSDSTTPTGPFIGTTGTFVDGRDGRSYRWVRIDEEIYMRDNLVYGQPDATYTWDEAMAGATAEGAQGACPAGWHVPTAAEWNRTAAYIGPTWWGSGTNAAARLRGQNETAYFNATNNHWLSTSAADPSKAALAAIFVSAYAEARDYPRVNAYAVRCAKDSVPGVHEPMP